MKDVKYYKTHKFQTYDLEDTKLPDTYKEGVALKCISCAYNYISAYKCKNVMCPLYELKLKCLKKPHTESEHFKKIKRNIQDNKNKETKPTIFYCYKITFITGSICDGMSYYGKHHTKDIDDNYMCSSSLVNNLIQNGEPYTRTILRIFDNERDSVMYEKLLIATDNNSLNREKKLSYAKYKQYKQTMKEKYPDLII